MLSFQANFITIGLMWFTPEAELKLGEHFTIWGFCKMLLSRIHVRDQVALEKALECAQAAQRMSIANSFSEFEVNRHCIGDLVPSQGYRSKHSAMADTFPIVVWNNIIGCLQSAGLYAVDVPPIRTAGWKAKFLQAVRTEGNCVGVSALRATQHNMLLLVCTSPLPPDPKRRRLSA